ncbi:1-phosphofructokinase family hexose kinase [Dermatophilus congolensis]|uniref:Tagatose-6-phosphate kinase n=1 Tax=Dermatophilus congolensis TaxID=1863 RepID=A0AA46BPF9_9MICO|nr:1-phosphofructokinase family hexose kinase [Dermatophilus congolensis]MBO3143546.1 1-phosphofructokinase family hexose kinase [Dermatophilus congolensis]MBO3152537.1 1-phosphofructokinase family hexose kinase [Dermatophilus congolensis]MBO3160452.1 1-phosphofructokinase family hexose kinase [Dermatophilus congolensis]MBO3163823.1 1-phosphofructokinase family hexose kinase [Dermatophilus congolensis]MBO3177369.1 1-phosphofructokinase family hexose kinase [Dermatophilus congolensis]
MIVTLTTNPSVDRSAHLRSGLERGLMHRLGDVVIEPGGKGVNVARALQLAGKPVVAVLPASPREQLLTLLEMRGVPFSAIDVAAGVRTNLTLTEADGTTTKFNEPGGEISPQEVNALRSALLIAAERADWVVLSGSLQPGVPHDFYVDLIRTLRQMQVKVTLDASDAPLAAVARSLQLAAPNFFKPNASELAQASGFKVRVLREAVAAGDWEVIAQAGRLLVERGIDTVLATMGSAGGVLVDAQGAWLAQAREVTVRSQVAAGDSTIAGYLLAQMQGQDQVGCLRHAVAYGSAAVGLEGSGVPTPDQARPEDVEVVAL